MGSKPSVTGFTQTDYRALLIEMVSQYNCLDFNILSQEVLPERFAIIRHDIDFSPDRALALARIEAEVGVKANYTVLLNGEYYSPFEKKVQSKLVEINELGHNVGLHFDAAWHEIQSEEDLEFHVDYEASILRRILGAPSSVNFFSFHNTTHFTMSCHKKSYGGLWNAYAGVLQKEVQYTSDSNGYWIYRSWEKLLSEKHPRIQVLTHPEWWCELDAEPGEKIASEIFFRGFSGWLQYDGLLNKLSRVNKTGLDSFFSSNSVGNDISLFQYLWLSGLRELACFGCFLKIAEVDSSSVDSSAGELELVLRRSLSDHELKELFERLLNKLVKVKGGK